MSITAFQTIIVGSGAAAFNAANILHEKGQTNIAIVTEALNSGTSRNTGSDKQTFYKQSTSGDADSPYNMAKTLFDGGGMHGDIALIEAALSHSNFYNLARIGVPFPTDKYGQHIGYKTDHDPFRRASSAGPYTSKYMTECLQKQVEDKGVAIFDGHQVISILQDEGEVIGLLCLTDADDFVAFNCTNIIYCTGGPACVYDKSVFPPSQFGGTGVALAAGVAGINLGEWQYGLASTKFRWNVSGTYQQVLPRYVSTDQNMNDEQDFLCDYYPSTGKMNDAVFLKGYQWPFDPRKIADFGSSAIDILVYIETQIKGRRVFMDFTKNPTHPDSGDIFETLGEEAHTYLKNSDALFGTPIERLQKMNPLAIQLYADNGIDITREYLEIDMCAQHNNGGLDADIWWQSNLRGFFPVGEVCGTLGVYRPGGSALNSTQTGGVRAAEYIVNRRNHPPLEQGEFSRKAEKQIAASTNKPCNAPVGDAALGVPHIYHQKLMTKSAAFLRTRQDLETCLHEIQSTLQTFWQQPHPGSRSEIFRNYDMLVTQFTYLHSMLTYVQAGGKSRGSYLIIEENGTHKFEHPALSFSYSIDTVHHAVAPVTTYCDKTCTAKTNFQPVRPIPTDDIWFEKGWEEYRTGKIYQ